MKKLYMLNHITQTFRFAVLALAMASMPLGAWSQKITIDLKNVTVQQAVMAIQKQHGYSFSIKADDVNLGETVSISAKNKELQDVLRDIFASQDLDFVVTGKSISVVKKTSKESDEPARQQITVSGRISDKSGAPLPGANVIVKGTTRATVANSEGKFSIRHEQGETLIFSFIGYDSEELIPQKSNINVVLKEGESFQELDEAVVVAYGTQTRSSLSSSISTLSGEKIKNEAGANISNMIGGKMTGVLTSQGSGEPGNDQSSVFIRGIATNSSNNQPLIVINGVVSSMSALNRLDQTSVKSISVLKDATAVAPYGMAGANGVILITLKTGEKGETKISYDSYIGFQNPTRIIDRLNSYEYVTAYNTARINQGMSPMFSDKQVRGFRATCEGDDYANPDAFPNTNAYKQYRKKNTPMMSHSIGLSGGNDNVTYYLNVGYMNQKGMWETANRTRYNIVSNISVQATKTTEVKFNINASRDNNAEPGIGGGNVMNITQLYLPIDPTVYSNGLLGASVPLPGRNGGLVLNDIINQGYLKTSSTTAQIQASIHQKIIEGLTFTGTFTYSPDFWSAKQWQLPTSPYYRYDLEKNEYNKVESLNEKARLYERKNNGENNNYVGQLKYTNNFYKHDFTVMAAIDYTEGNSNYLEGSKKNYIVNIDELNQGSSNPIDWTMLNGNSSYFKWLGVIGRINYNYNSKYYAEVAGRYDGHYYFGPGHRFGTFPSASLAWRASEEQFIKDRFSFINNLKIRASYGLSGNLASEPFQYMSSYTLMPGGAILDGQAYQSLRETREANPAITWEVAKKFNTGLDLTMWKGLLDFTFDYFYEVRNNMLVSPGASVSSEYGIGLSQINDGIMHNRGFEITLGSRYEVNKDLKVGIRADFTFARNKSVKLYESAATYDDPKRRRTGRPLNSIFGLKAERLYQEDDFHINGELKDKTIDPGVVVRPGDIKYSDESGDKIIDGKDEVMIGKSPFPEIMYGITPTVSYKGFDLTVFLQGVANNSILLFEQLTQPFYTAEVSPVAEVVRDSWTPENTGARYPRLLTGQRTNNATTSSWWVWDASYFRIKNVQLGYKLPDKWMGKIKVNSWRIYVSATNLYTFTKVPFIDPEISATGLTRNGQAYGAGASYPQQQVYQLGMNIVF